MTVSILNTIAGAADVTLSAGRMKIAEANTAGQSWIFKNITNSPVSLNKFTAEKRMVQEVSYTAASATEYSFVITQPVDGVIQRAVISYTSDASGTDAEIAAALVGIVNKLENIKVTASGTVTPITLTADAGYAISNATAINNTTVTNVMTVAPDVTAATAIAGTTTVTVTTAAAHGLQTGNIVNITGVATMTVAGGLDGVAAGATVRAKITYTGATTFTLDDVTGAGTNSGTIVITVQATNKSGTYLDVLADGITTYDSAYNYASLTINSFENAGSQLGKPNFIEKEQKVWIKQSLVASPYTVNTNLAAFITELNLTLNAVITGTTADAEAIAVK